MGNFGVFGLPNALSSHPGLLPEEKEMTFPALGWFSK